MKITPLNEFVIIKVDEEKKQSDGGILIPAGTLRLPSTGTVLAVSDDIIVTEIKEGMRVAFLRYAALDGPEDGTRICKLEHILGVIEDDETGT